MGLLLEVFDVGLVFAVAFFVLLALFLLGIIFDGLHAFAEVKTAQHEHDKLVEGISEDLRAFAKHFNTRMYKYQHIRLMQTKSWMAKLTTRTSKECLPILREIVLRIAVKLLGAHDHIVREVGNDAQHPKAHVVPESEIVFQIIDRMNHQIDQLKCERHEYVHHYNAELQNQTVGLHLLLMLLLRLAHRLFAHVRVVSLLLSEHLARFSPISLILLP